MIIVNKSFFFFNLLSLIFMYILKNEDLNTKTCD